MSTVEVSYQEATESVRVEAVPLAHLSVEVGHLYLDDFTDGDRGDRLIRDQFELMAPSLEAAERRLRSRLGKQARISTCFLIDDHSSRSGDGPPATPSEVAALVASAAKDKSLRIDYLAREAGCAWSTDKPFTEARDHVALAEIVTGLIVEEPEVGANGSRPPTSQTGWLSNGARRPNTAVAMGSVAWQPPEELGKRNHSVFLDAELWRLEEFFDESRGRREQRRVYSCSLLSAVWHLLRLGLIRDEGRPVARPWRFEEGADLPELWSDMPTVFQMTADAEAFAAYRSLSLLPADYRPTEHAAEVILDHIRIDAAVLDQIDQRVARERDPMELPRRIARRMSHVFLGDV